MMKFDIEVRVWLKPSVFDPQGHAVENSLLSLGHTNIQGMRVGKYMQFSLSANNSHDADLKVKQVCEEVLCNPVMETYAYTMKVSVEA